MGHIEDIVVCDSMRGKGMGKWIIKQLVHAGQQLGAYKIILDSAEHNVAFYEKCDFKRKSICMAHYF